MMALLNAKIGIFFLQKMLWDFFQIGIKTNAEETLLTTNVVNQFLARHSESLYYVCAAKIHKIYLMMW